MFLTDSNTNDDDPNVLSVVDSEQNLFANVISKNPFLFEESVPNKMDQHLLQVSDYNQILGISPLTSSDLQEIESMDSGWFTHQMNHHPHSPRSTFKRICRANGIARWSRKLQIAPQPAMATLTQSNIGVKVSYNGLNVRFPLSLSSGKNDLEVEVEKRFGIQTGSFWIKYEDEDEDWILITCDEDLHHGMNTCIERGITTIKMHVG
ncbi:hypothetical protein P3S67_029945 [Capsicum chacoense]